MPNVTFDAASNYDGQIFASSFSWSHTCSGNDRCLVVGVSIRGSTNGIVSSITYNGVSLTKIAHAEYSDTANRIELWYLLNPATGSNTIEVTLTGSAYVTGGAISLNNVEALGSYNSAADGNTDTPTVDVANCSEGCMVVDAVGENDDTALSVGSGQTERYKALNAQISIGGSTEAGTGTVTMSWSLAASEYWAIVAAEFEPVVAKVNSLFMVRIFEEMKMVEKPLKSTRDIDYEAPFRIMLEKYLPQVLMKLLAENGNIAEAIDAAITRQRKRKGDCR